MHFIISLDPKSQVWQGSYREKSKSLQKNGQKIKLVFFRGPELFVSENCALLCMQRSFPTPVLHQPINIGRKLFIRERKQKNEIVKRSKNY